MAKNTQPVLKRARSLGIEPQFMGVNKKSRRNPEQSRKKKSNYAIQLAEKQKVKFVYGLLETQFRNTFEKAAKKEGNAGENFLIMLEQRLDNVVFRLGFAATRREARQLVSHGHFRLNGHKANIPSMQIKPGDVIEVKEKSKSSPKFKEIREMLITTPKWLSVDVDNLKGTVVAAPAREDIDLQIEEHYIVEFYSK